MRLSLLVFLFGAAVLVSAHSWLGCSDYRGPVDFYDDSKCLAYPRYWQSARSAHLAIQTNGYQMGGDSGYNYQPGGPCNLPMASPWENAYTSDYPYAIYEQGQVYCLAWPTKNHAAASCTNQYIPDTKMTIYRTDANPSSDPTSQATFDANPVSHNFGVHTDGQVDCLGFQRSPRFCDNTDKAMATGCIQIPADLAPGHYVFQWYWIFNPGAPYITCWDAKVVAAGQGRGGGGMTGADTIVDNLGGNGATCKTAWEAEALRTFAIPTPGGAAPPAPPLSSTGMAPPPTPEASTDQIDIVSAPTQIERAEGTTFKVKLEYFATQRRAVTVDVLHLDAEPPIWYGKAEAFVDATTTKQTVELTVKLHKEIPGGTNYILRAWMVDEDTFTAWQECDYCSTIEPWTNELDRRDRSILVGESTVAEAGCAGGGSGGKYDDADIAGTFFGTFLIMLAIFALVYWFILRPKMTGTK